MKNSSAYKKLNFGKAVQSEVVKNTILATDKTIPEIKVNPLNGKYLKTRLLTIAARTCTMENRNAITLTPPIKNKIIWNITDCLLNQSRTLKTRLSKTKASAMLSKTKDTIVAITYNAERMTVLAVSSRIQNLFWCYKLINISRKGKVLQMLGVQTAWVPFHFIHL
jgi:uncharacterized protein YjiK